ncbi:hypothetical protein KIN20_008918, partial [Parelaphostrongylus tenuis]
DLKRRIRRNVNRKQMRKPIDRKEEQLIGEKDTNLLESNLLKWNTGWMKNFTHYGILVENDCYVPPKWRIISRQPALFHSNELRFKAEFVS